MPIFSPLAHLNRVRNDVGPTPSRPIRRNAPLTVVRVSAVFVPLCLKVRVYFGQAGVCRMLALDLLENAPAVDNGRRTGRKSRLHASVLGTPATSSFALGSGHVHELRNSAVRGLGAGDGGLAGLPPLVGHALGQPAPSLAVALIHTPRRDVQVLPHARVVWLLRQDRGGG